jgi:queuosine precursor transporter
MPNQSSLRSKITHKKEIQILIWYTMWDMKAQVHSFKYFDLVLAAFVAVLLISNVSAVKLISFGSIITDGGAFLFPLVYIFGDLLTEVYGYKFARRAIWTGFGASLLAAVTYLVVQSAPPAAEAWPYQQSFEDILGFVPRIVLASMAAYLVGQFINSYVLSKLKLHTKGKRLWLRLIGSTVVGEFFDTLIFCLVAFGGVLTGWDMINYIIVGWVFKVSVEIILLPVTYRVIAFFKKREGVDAYDKKVDFSPFHIAVK